MRPDPYDLGPDGLAALLDDQPPYRARQVWRWLLRGVEDPDAMTDLPPAVRATASCAERFTGGST
jgi:23S rRNA (adenine2503-C2)-methyltransferase